MSSTLDESADAQSNSCETKCNSADAQVADQNDSQSIDSGGFLDNDIRPSLFSLLTLSICSLFLSSFPLPLASCLSVFMALLTHKWYNIHGNQLTRKELIFFDEKVLLEIATGCDYENGLAEEVLTPGPGKPEAKKSEPLSIWEALFCDEKTMNIQNFYKSHYGSVWATAEKRRKERELFEKQKTDSIRTTISK